MTEFEYRNLHLYKDLPDRLVIGLSGGRSSWYQAAHIIEANGGKLRPDWVLCFENTSLEVFETYDFLQKIENYLGFEITKLEFNPDAPGKFEVVNWSTMKRNGEVMDRFLNTPLGRRDGTFGVRPLPNPVQRTCTATLKIKTAHRYVRHALGWPMQYYAAIGYRACPNDTPRYWNRWLQDERRGFDEGGIMVGPMFEAGVDVDEVERFGRTGPFDLEIDSIFGNCDLCFMISTWKIKERMMWFAILEQVKVRPGAAPPRRVQRWIDWEERQSDRPGCFRKDRPPIRVIWNQVCEGNMESCNVGENRDDRCGSCTD